MIEWVDAASGGRVLRVRGKLMASRFDPEKEARDWLARRGTLLQQVKTVIVLGAGSVHALKLLRKTAPDARIIVFEAYPEVIDAVLPHIQNIEFVPLTSDIKTLLRPFIGSSFVVLTYAPSVLLDPERYEALRRLCLGRDPLALQWQWNSLGFSEMEIAPIHDPVTIHHLDQANWARPTRERLLVRALRELVK